MGLDIGFVIVSKHSVVPLQSWYGVHVLGLCRNPNIQEAVWLSKWQTSMVWYWYGSVLGEVYANI